MIVSAELQGKIQPDYTGTSFFTKGSISVGGYAPGSNPIVFPNGDEIKMGVTLPANSEIILQIHTPSGTTGQLVKAQVRLYFYPIREPNIREVLNETWINDLFQQFSIPANQVTTLWRKSPPMTNAISVYSAFPHSHNICTEILNFAYLGLDTIPLIYIPKWDFAHQVYYNYNNLVKIPSGYSFKGSHVFDNTSNNHHNPNHDNPVDVKGGLATEDEMIFDSYQFIEYQPGDENIDINKILSEEPLLNLDTTLNSNFPNQEKLTASYIYPNPLTNVAYINFYHSNKSQGTFGLNVYDVKGGIVNMNYEVLNGVILVKKGDLLAGNYFYEITNSGKVFSKGKILIK
jgi:hypothetical protein